MEPVEETDGRKPWNQPGRRYTHLTRSVAQVRSAIDTVSLSFVQGLVITGPRPNEYQNNNIRYVLVRMPHA